MSDWLTAWNQREHVFVLFNTLPLTPKTCAFKNLSIQNKTLSGHTFPLNLNTQSLLSLNQLVVQGQWGMGDGGVQTLKTDAFSITSSNLPLINQRRDKSCWPSWYGLSFPAQGKIIDIWHSITKHRCFGSNPSFRRTGKLIHSVLAAVRCSTSPWLPWPSNLYHNVVGRNLVSFLHVVIYNMRAVCVCLHV